MAKPLTVKPKKPLLIHRDAVIETISLEAQPDLKVYLGEAWHKAFGYEDYNLTFPITLSSYEEGRALLPYIGEIIAACHEQYAGELLTETLSDLFLTLLEKSETLRQRKE